MYRLVIIVIILLLFAPQVLLTRVVYSSCGGYVRHYESEIRYPYFGSYRNGENCTWMINASSSVIIRFQRFFTETGYDFLQINDGNRYMGLKIPPVIGPFSGLVKLTFCSDRTNVRNGFSAYIDTVPCRGNISSPCPPGAQCTKIVARRPYYICRCFHGGDGRNCSDMENFKQGFSVTCNEKYVIGTWNKRVFGGADKIVIQLNSPACNKYQSNSTHIWIKTSFTACGSNITELEHKILQKNTAKVTAVYTRNDLTTRQRKYTFHMECIIKRSHIITVNGYNVTDIIKLPIKKSVEILFDVTMKIYTTASYLQSVPVPYTVTSFQPIYVAIKSSHKNENFKMSVHQCFATPTKSHYGISDIFFHNKCAIDPTFHILEATSSTFRFVINAFKFIEVSSSVYIHCRIHVCKETSIKRECRQICSPRGRLGMMADDSSDTIHYYQPTSNFSIINRDINDDVNKNSGRTNSKMESRQNHTRRRRNINNKKTNIVHDMVVTSSEIQFKRFVTCVNLKCPLFSKCVNAFPVKCRCLDTFVFNVMSKTCTNERIFTIENLHINIEWLPAYSNTNSREFLMLVDEFEQKLMNALFSSTHIEGLKIKSARKGSVIFNLLLSHSALSNEQIAFGVFMEMITSTESDMNLKDEYKIILDGQLRLKRGHTGLELGVLVMIIVFSIVVFATCLLSVARIKACLEKEEEEDIQPDEDRLKTIRTFPKMTMYT